MDENINNEILDRNVNKINGPINVVRLEGNVHGIKKVIYLFMDIHVGPNAQTECENIYSKDVNEYFVENFSKINKMSNMYDFFMETRPTEDLTGRLVGIRRYKFKYIAQMVKLFSILFNFDKDKNKVNVPDIFKNIRLHYLDIRDYLAWHIFYPLDEVYAIAIDIYNNGIMLNGLKRQIDSLTMTKENLQFIINVLSSKNYEEPKQKPVTIKEKELTAIDTETIARFNYKIHERYNYDNIKKILNGFIVNVIDDLKELIKEIDLTIKDLDNYGNFYYNNSNGRLIKNDVNPDKYVYGIDSYTFRDVVKNIADMTSRLVDISTRIFALLTDIYFLRRFLDKDYITNAIVYSGAGHSMHYIHILVNYFDFEITHVSYSAISNLNELMKEVRKRTSTDITPLFWPTILHQCSDITHFPDNFL